MSPTPYRYHGEGCFEALPRFRAACDKAFVIGETYTLDEWQERSPATHNHEFAWLAEAWKTLPENVAHEYPSPEHLRKKALVQAGFYDETIVDAGTNAAALRVAAAFRSREEFAIVFVRGVFVIIRTAKSQSRRAMNKAEFQASKDGILRVVSELLGVEPEALSSQGRQAA